jgi:mRNA interferase MazF
VEALKQYEIWWASLPRPAGRRPVLLLSRDSAYSYLNKFVVVEITTTVRDLPVEVPLGRREGLPRTCAANCDNIHTVVKRAILERIGMLAPARYHEVKRAVGYALAWNELREQADLPSSVIPN